MVFESRALSPYAKPVETQELSVGSIYFFLNYLDTDMLIPTLEPMVFIGRNLEPNDVGEVYFQDVASYREGIRYEASGPDAEGEFSSGLEKETNHVFEYESALEELMRCSIRRHRSKTPISEDI